MTHFQISQRNARRTLVAGMVLAVTLSASAALAQTVPLSYAVPDSGAWSDILKNNGKAPARSKAATERKKPAQRQAKARPSTSSEKKAAREAFAMQPPKTPGRSADVRIVAPDEFNEIDQMAATPQAQ
jgi:hypothetical protein